MTGTPARSAAASSMSPAGKDPVLMVDGGSRGNPGPPAIAVAIRDALANRAIEQAFPESTLEFSAILEKEDKLYVARVPAFGVKGYGATRSEALEMARDEVIERIRELRTQGKGLPKEERIRVRVTGDSVQ